MTDEKGLDKRSRGLAVLGCVALIATSPCCVPVEDPDLGAAQENKTLKAPLGREVGPGSLERWQDSTLLAQGTRTPLTAPSSRYRQNVFVALEPSWESLEVEDGPGPRRYAVAVEDTWRHVVVLFGGDANVQQVLSDTWELDGSTWAPLTTPSHPSPRYGHALTTHGAAGGVLLFGGGMPVHGDTWLLRLKALASP